MDTSLTVQQTNLLDKKNDLIDTTREKYRLAGMIAQTGLQYVLGLVRHEYAEKTMGEMCRLGDEFLHRATATAFKRDARERGIAMPTQIEKNGFVSGVAPEADDSFQGGQIVDGDIVKVSLGVHIDGYTATVSHTLVIREDTPTNPLMGPAADAMVAAYIATEAVINLLSLAVSPNSPLGPAGVTGTSIRELVESIASTFRTRVVPGSRVRRVRRFLAGQSDAVQESDAKGVFWDQDTEEARVLGEQVSDDGDDFRVDAGEVWVVDIQMAGTEGTKGAIRLKEFTGYSGSSAAVRPAVYSRDYTVTYALKVAAARQLLARISNETSVYPFKLSYLAADKSELNAARLGLGELVQRFILVPHPVRVAELHPLAALQTSSGLSKSAIKKLVKEVPVAREQATLMLVPGARSTSGYPEAIRLTGGRTTAPPSWVHSRYEITDARIQELLALKLDKKTTGVSFQVVRPSTFDAEQLVRGDTTAPDAEMDIDN